MKFNKIFMAGLALVAGLAVTSCKPQWPDTDPFNKNGVTIATFGPCPVLRLDTIQIMGAHLDMVSAVMMPVAENDVPAYKAIDRKDLVEHKENRILVQVPFDAFSSKIGLVSGKDTIWSITNLTFQETAQVDTIMPLTGVSAGDIVTVKGEYLNNVALIQFANGEAVEAIDFKRLGRNVIEFMVPAGAASGQLTFTDGGDWSQTFETPMQIITASVSKVATAPAEDGTYEFEQKITIEGENLHTITSVIFPGGIEAEFTAEGPGTDLFKAPAAAATYTNTLTFTVPKETCSGAVVMKDAANHTFTIFAEDAFKVPTIEITSASKTTNVKEGDVLTFEVEKLNRVRAVFLMGEELAEKDYTIEGNTLTLTMIEKDDANGDLVLVQTDNISKTLALEVVAKKSPMWKGNVVMNAEADAVVFPADDAKVAKMMDAKGTMVFYTVFGETGATLKLVVDGVESEDLFATRDENGKSSIEITDELYDLIIKQAKGFKVVGTNGVKLKTVCYESSAQGGPVALWEGEVIADGWGNQPYLLSDGGKELADANVYAGLKLRFYIEPLREGDWKVEIVEGHWGPTYGSYCNVGCADTEDGKFTETDISAGYIEIELTQAMIDAAMTQQWWGGTFLLNGDNVKCTAIEVVFPAPEVTLWEGEAIADGWGNQPYLLSDAGTELVAANAYAGQTINFYLEPLREGDWKVEVVEGHWGSTYGSYCNVGCADTEDGKFTEYDLDANGGKLTLTLTQAMLDAALTQQWWGGSFLLNGDNIKCTAVTLQ